MGKDARQLPGVASSRAAPVTGSLLPRMATPAHSGRLYCSFALAAHEFFNSINPITFRTINVFFAMLSARIGFLLTTTDAGIAEVHTEKCPESAGNYNGPAQGALPGLPIMLVPMRPLLSVPCACSVGVAHRAVGKGSRTGERRVCARKRSFRGFSYKQVLNEYYRPFSDVQVFDYFLIDIRFSLLRFI